MTGKIFKESSNVYEDEAKILFDYYKEEEKQKEKEKEMRYSEKVEV